MLKSAVFTIAFGLSCLCCFSGSAIALAAPADEASVAWLRDGKVEVYALASSAKLADRTVPLGSLWKLFVYAYLHDTQANESAYTCTKKVISHSEERYCCDPGEQVQRDSALARSCAPYFAPSRLGITTAAWKAYWQPRSNLPWLLDMSMMQPDTHVKLSELLLSLNQFSVEARMAARKALLETSIEGYGRDAWSALGSGIRYKTYSWHLPDNSAFGGATGWLVDGTPFWFGAPGSSRSALSAWKNRLAVVLPTPRLNKFGNADTMGDNASCVDVDFFARYPIREVSKDNNKPASAGKLNGRYRIDFVSGSTLEVQNNSALVLSRPPSGAPYLSGRFSINDYVARVVDREGGANPTEAARALSIVARTYLIQNATFEGGCWHIPDATNRQRVSANPPSDSALAVAWFSDELILSGANVHYHLDTAGRNRMSWKQATKQALDGWNFERILLDSYPNTNIVTLAGRSDCRPLDTAQAWLAQAMPLWAVKMQREPGFEPLHTAPKICALDAGSPYSDQQRLRIYVRGWRSLDERITLAHEYLHLAFRFHPSGANEAYIERLARQLIEGTL